MRSLLLLVQFICLLVPTNHTLSRADRRPRAPEETCTPGDPACEKSAQLLLSLDDTTVMDRNLVEVQVVPRLIFQEWCPQHLWSFLSSPERGRRLVGDIIALLQGSGMHGVVLEAWKQMPAGLFLDFLRTLSDKFRVEELYLILVVPPTNPDPEGAYNASHFSLTGPLLDSIEITTYDYSLLSKRPGPSAPLPLVEACAEV